MTLYYVIGLLIIVPFMIGLMMKPRGSFGKGPLVAGIFMAAVSVAIYTTTMYDSGHVAWLDRQEELLPDVQTLLSTDEAPESLKQLDGAHFLSLLSYYAKEYPQDSRVWQKLAVVMVSLQMPEEALQAVRRYLALEPENLQARQLEIQLLGDLVQQGSISSRQLWFALDKFKDSKALTPQDYFFLAGLSRQHEFYDLAIAYWELVIAVDKRPDSALEPKALQGRLLLQRMIDDAKDRLEEGTHVFAEEDSKPEKDADQNVSAPVSGNMVSLNLKASAKTQDALQQYLQETDNATYQIWLSVRHQQPGPPLAAKLIWLKSDDLQALTRGLKVNLTTDDLIMSATWPFGESVQISIAMVLSDEKSDPVAAQQSQYRQVKTLSLSTETVSIEF